MDLKDYFVKKSGEMSVKLKTDSPIIKKQYAGKDKNKTVKGILAAFEFNKFKFELSYTESSRGVSAQQYMWVNFVLESDSTLPFSLYDILSFLQPENFNCYTYTFVDSQELMDSCFEELEGLLCTLIPQLNEFLESGVNKNQLISAQKDALNKYFGEDVLESGEFLGGRADNLINMMISNFYRTQIIEAVLGAQAVFYDGKPEKALKQLKKYKQRTLYQENLLKYLENGGKPPKKSEAAEKASQGKGALRHGGGAKGGLELLGFTFLYLIPIAIFVCMLYLLITVLYFKNAPLVFGIIEGLVFIPFFCIILALALALNHTWKKQKAPAKSESAVHTPKSKATDIFIKYFIIAGETLALVGAISSLFFCTAFYEDRLTYSESDFSFSQEVCRYESIEYIAVIDGYAGYNEITEKNNEFYEDRHLAVKTKSGMTIDLYNSTFFSVEKIDEHKEFFEKKGIEIKNFRTIENMNGQ